MTVLIAIHGRATSTKQLHYNAAQELFFGCISDTNGLSRVYDDSVDEGMALESSRTGRHVVCVVTHVEYDREGDLRYWLLKPINGPLDFTVQLFND